MGEKYLDRYTDKDGFKLSGYMSGKGSNVLNFHQIKDVVM